MQPLYLLLGSNYGSRAEYISRAKQAISEQIGVIEKESLWYETAPWGNTEQNDFLNQSVLVYTDVTPHNILQTIKGIEQSVGRTANFRWGPREIDIDILLLGDTVFESDTLHIPHRELHNRKFALVALNDIGAEAVHPVFNITVSELLAACTDECEVKPLQPNPYGL